MEIAIVLRGCKSVASRFERVHVELIQILVAGGLTRDSYNAETSLIIGRLVVLVLLSQDTQRSFTID